MRHAGGRQTEFYARERAKKAEFVAFAEMADAEDLAGDLAEAGAERDIVFLQRDLAEAVGVMTFGSTELMRGFDFLVVVIGLFGVSEILLTVEEGLVFKGKQARIDLKVVLKTWAGLPRYWATLLRSAVVGMLAPSALNRPCHGRRPARRSRPCRCARRHTSHGHCRSDRNGLARDAASR